MVLSNFAMVLLGSSSFWCHNENSLFECRYRSAVVNMLDFLLNFLISCLIHSGDCLNIFIILLELIIAGQCRTNPRLAAVPDIDCRIWNAEDNFLLRIFCCKKGIRNLNIEYNRNLRVMTIITVHSCSSKQCLFSGRAFYESRTFGG